MCMCRVLSYERPGGQVDKDDRPLVSVIYKISGDQNQKGETPTLS